MLNQIADRENLNWNQNDLSRPMCHLDGGAYEERDCDCWTMKYQIWLFLDVVLMMQV